MIPGKTMLSYQQGSLRFQAAVESQFGNLEFLRDRVIEPPQIYSPRSPEESFKNWHRYFQQYRSCGVYARSTSGAVYALVSKSGEYFSELPKAVSDSAFEHNRLPNALLVNEGRRNFWPALWLQEIALSVFGRFTHLPIPLYLNQQPLTAELLQRGLQLGWDRPAKEKCAGAMSEAERVKKYVESRGGLSNYYYLIANTDARIDANLDHYNEWAISDPQAATRPRGMEFIATAISNYAEAIALSHAAGYVFTDWGGNSSFTANNVTVWGGVTDLDTVHKSSFFRTHPRVKRGSLFIYDAAYAAQTADSFMVYMGKEIPLEDRIAADSGRDIGRVFLDAYSKTYEQVVRHCISSRLYGFCLGKYFLRQIERGFNNWREYVGGYD